MAADTSLPDGAFCTFVKNTKLVRVQPPGCHVVCRVTGGLATLYRQVKQSQQESHEYASCTDENGIFKPGLLQKVPLLAKRYQYVSVIGSGISSVLVQAVDTYRRDNYEVAIKILHTDYKMLGYQEADTVLRLNRADPSNFSRIIQLLNTFTFEGHFCMVYELLHPKSLHKVINKDLCQDEKLKLIRKISLQLLQVLGFLSQADVIHADLKPENILCCSDDITDGIKVIDFGNAIHCIFNELALYYDDFQLQTLLYRAPEVAFGLPFGPEIDMWSVGCILAELYIGEPLFPAKSKEFLLTRMVGLLGPLPCSPFNRGKFHSEMKGFIGKTQPPHVTVNKISHYLRGSPDFNFVTFLFGMLKYNPDERMSVSEAFQHPFIAPEVAGRFLLPGLSESSTYSTLHLDPSLYNKSPEVSADIAKECLFGVDLLRRGTFRKAVAKVPPFSSKRRTPSLTVCPQPTFTSPAQYSETGTAVNQVIPGAAVIGHNSRTGEESRVNSGVVNSHVNNGALDSRIHISDLDSRVHSSALDSRIHRGAFDSHVSSGAFDSHIHISALDSHNHSSALDSRIHSGMFDTRIDNSAFVANHREAESINEVVDVPNKECNNEKTKENQVKNHLFVGSKDEDVTREPHGSVDSAMQRTLDVARGINSELNVCSYTHGSSPPVAKHSHSVKPLPRNEESGHKVTQRRRLNSQTYTQYMVRSVLMKTKKTKVKSAVRKPPSLSSLKKHTEKSTRQRKIFEHFDKSRQIALKRCADGFKELVDEEDSRVEDVQVKTKDPYDFDRTFNKVQTPAKSFYGERTKFKPNASKSINKQFGSVLKTRGEKRLKMETKNEKTDILKMLIPRDITAPSTTMHNSILETGITKSDFCFPTKRQSKAASKQKNEATIKLKTDETKIEYSNETVSICRNNRNREQYQTSKRIQDHNSEVHIGKLVENDCDSKCVTSESIEEGSELDNDRKNVVNKSVEDVHNETCFRKESEEMEDIQLLSGEEEDDVLLL